MKAPALLTGLRQSPQDMKAVIRPTRNARPILLVGFGGLLFLMALAALDDLRILRSIQTRSDSVRTHSLSATAC